MNLFNEKDYGLIKISELPSGYLHARGRGPCEWAQWPRWERVCDASFFDQASTKFRDALIRLECRILTIDSSSECRRGGHTGAMRSGVCIRCAAKAMRVCTCRQDADEPARSCPIHRGA